MKWEKISTKNKYNTKTGKKKKTFTLPDTEHYIRSKLTSRNHLKKKEIISKIYKLMKKKMYRKTKPQLYTSKKKKKNGTELTFCASTDAL